jgi:hypothetical protein
MGEVQSTSRLFPAAGSEGIGRGVRLRNAALIRRLPFGNRWHILRIGILANVETFGIVRDSQQPGTGLMMGVCSGPWSVGDSAGKTLLAIGVNVFGAHTYNNDWQSSWNQAKVGGQNVWNSTAVGRGFLYYLSSTGSYANGGDATTRVWGTGTSQSSGGQFGIPDSTGTPRRTAMFVDLYRQPSGSTWSFRTNGTVYNNANMAFDMPEKSYLMSLTHFNTGTADPWYDLASPTVGSATDTTPTITATTPLDYLDIYWDSYTMGLELWRVDVLKLA